MYFRFVVVRRCNSVCARSPPLCLRCMAVGHIRRDCAVPVPPTLAEGNAWQRRTHRQPRWQRWWLTSPWMQPRWEGYTHTGTVGGGSSDDNRRWKVRLNTATILPGRPRRKEAGWRGREVRDTCSKIHPNRYVSDVTGVTKTSNPFDVLGLLSDEDSSPGYLYMDMDA